MAFFYTLLWALLHSLWQSALLVLLYKGLSFFAINAHPLQKRNFLIGLLVLQLIFTIAYFFRTAIIQDDLLLYLNYYTLFLQKYASSICSIYMVVVFSKIFIVSYVWQAQYKRYRTSFIKPMVSHKMFAQLKAAEMGIGKNVKIAYSHLLKVPITFGFLKPIILIPLGLVNNLNEQEIETIIIHELTHIKHNDYLINCVVIVIDAIYFFNPFVKMLIRNLWLEREKNCDMQVLQFEYPPLPYAQVLLNIAQFQNTTLPLEMAAVKSSYSLLKRVQYFLLNENQFFKKYHIQWFTLLCIGLITTTAILLTAPTRENDTVQNNFSTFTLANNKYKKSKLVFQNDQLIAKNAVSIKAKKLNKRIPNPIKKELNRSNAISPNTIDPIFRTVKYLEKDIDSVKVVEYFEETAEGKMRQYYELIKIKGNWILIPKIMLEEKNIDSLHKLKGTDTLHYQ